MKIFTIDIAAKTETINRLKFSITIRLTKYEVKNYGKNSTEPKLLQKQISKQLIYSDSTNKRNRDDIQMESLYLRNKYRKKNKKSKT